MSNVRLKRFMKITVMFFQYSETLCVPFQQTNTYVSQSLYLLTAIASETSRASCLYLLVFSILFYKCSICSHLPIIQSILPQLLPHVSDQHTRQSQQGLGISHLEQSDYSLAGCVSNHTQIYTNIRK